MNEVQCKIFIRISYESHQELMVGVSLRSGGADLRCSRRKMIDILESVRRDRKVCKNIPTRDKYDEVMDGILDLQWA